MGLQFLFMDDNAPCHRTVAAEQLLESEDIERMDWPARSPDLNPIEHVWDFLGRRLAARTLPPVTIRELRLALQDEWAAMPQQLIDTLILSMDRRCETCLAVREIISPTKDRMFLAGHPSQGCFGLQSHCAPCYFFNQAFFIPLISLLISAQYCQRELISLEEVPNIDTTLRFVATAQSCDSGKVRSSKKYHDADSDDENKMNNPASVPTSSEMSIIMKSMRSYLDARSSGEMNNKVDDIVQFVDYLML
ncbi:transposable element Tcb2 transposase [Trichonephila clavipes]|nr:transposable element Tcb2 transposase [Trichonephila clavipes]